MAFWKSNSSGSPANGGSGPAREVGTVDEIAGPLQLCGKNALHATHSPHIWKGERMWLVAMYPPVQMQEGKVGSLKREILMEVPLI